MQLAGIHITFLHHQLKENHTLVHLRHRLWPTHCPHDVHLMIRVFAQLIQSPPYKGDGLGPLQREVKVNIIATTQCEDMSLSFPSMESTTGWSCSRETTSTVSAWSCARTVPSCRREASPRTASTPSRFMETERRYLCSDGSLDV